MPPTTNTTIHLDDSVSRRLNALARRQGRPTAELVREAVTAYVNAHARTERPASIGAGRSGLGDLSERTDDLLSGFGQH